MPMSGREAEPSTCTGWLTIAVWSSPAFAVRVSDKPICTVRVRMSVDVPSDAENRTVYVPGTVYVCDVGPAGSEPLLCAVAEPSPKSSVYVSGGEPVSVAPNDAVTFAGAVPTAGETDSNAWGNAR